MTIPKSLTSVTPLSKILAAVLFVTFPFIGFYLGMEFQKNSQPELSIPSENLILKKNAPTSVSDETANWKTYINQDGSYRFKYPADWVLTEEKDGVRAVIEPDFRTVVGACPGYSFWAGKPDPYANYSIYTPLQQKTINNQNISYYNKTNTYSCTSNIAFFSKSLVVELISKETKNQQLFDQILSTFKFLGKPEIVKVTKIPLEIPKEFQCTTDEDCGIDTCSCETRNKQYLDPEGKMCMRECDITPICFQKRCIAKGEENKYVIEIQ